LLDSLDPGKGFIKDFSCREELLGNFPCMGKQIVRVKKEKK
jgi:hypothetical protein